MNRRDHTLCALLLGVTISICTLSVVPLVLVYVGSNLPDLDAVVFKHRKTLHNVFSVVIITCVFYSASHGFWFVGVGMLLHIVLDMCSKSNVFFFYPLSNKGMGVRGPRNGTLWSTMLSLIITVLLCWLVVLVSKNI